MAESNVVLVHGAWARPSMWGDVESDLRGRGVEVTCADLPTMGDSGATLADDVEHVRSLIGAGPVVLVGHSYGGVVITEAATGQPAVSHLVYVASVVPDEGQSMFELGLRRPTDAGPPEMRDDGTALPAQWGNPDLYTPDVMARFEAESPRPFAVAGAVTPVSAPAWRDIDSTAVIAARDNILHPDTQRELAEAAGSRVVEINVAHVIPWAAPTQLAEVIAGVV